MKHNIFETIFEFLGVNPKVLFPALLGTLISIKRMKKMSVVKSFTSVVFGMSCAVYLTPLLIRILPEAWQLEYSIAFLVGYSGLSVLDVIFGLFSDKIKKWEEEMIPEIEPFTKTEIKKRKRRNKRKKKG